MHHAERTFVPAAGHDWLLPLYDPLQRWLGGESIKEELVAQANLRPGHRVLDIGCGTGTLAALLERLHPDTEVVGLDPDPKALARAQRRAQREHLAVRFDRGFSDELPYEDARFDRVFSSFMLHHLGSEEKIATLREARRALDAGGSFHLVDFGLTGRRADGLLARIVHRSEHLRDNVESRVLAMLRDAGFAGIEQTGHRSTVFGRVSFYRAST